MPLTRFGIGCRFRSCSADDMDFDRLAAKGSALGSAGVMVMDSSTDMVEALMLTLNSDAVGIFNIAGRGEIPLIEALDVGHILGGM